MLQTHTFFIDRHIHSVSLNGKWQFGYTDTATDTPEFPYTATLPASAYRNLCEAGILPDPYIGCNSKRYHWVDKKIWYYRRTFSLDDTTGKDVFLCFDGVGYACRVFLNGSLLCEHEGMFGGPICEISEFVRVGENTLTVEVTPPAPDYSRFPARDERSLAEIVPWNSRRDASASNGDFTVFGIWRSVRLEILPKYHLSRPYLYTESISYADGSASGNAMSFGYSIPPRKTPLDSDITAVEMPAAESATLRLSVELADPQIKELEVVTGEPKSGWSNYNFAYAETLDARPTGKQVDVAVKLVSKTTGDLAFETRQTVDILKKDCITSRTKFHECQFIELPIVLQNPRLWQPNRIGNSELYTVTLSLYDGNSEIDTLTFDTGVRTVEYVRTAGMRHRSRWDSYHFVVNGRPMFVKGINWMPIDFLYDITDTDYRWTLEMVKNLGVQVVRVWSGGGMPEDDRFYSLCDELGLLVIQDNFIANQTTEHWNREVLQSQVCQNLYRMRNHPSLAIHTGGNEINPYALNNDAAMWVIRREIEDLDPCRKFWNTSPDKGSTHIYRDMEPVWYRKTYGQLPFIGESGIHSFPNAKSIRQQISAEEYERPLSDIFSDEFSVKNPELRNHFTEFQPSRIPRMMSRASMINNIAGISLSDLCEATQMASCEFYQIMIQSMRENYPICCGILPWVFKRGWTTVAIQLVDGLGDTTFPYYYTKNAYSPLCAEISLDEITFAPEEVFTPKLSLLCDDTKSYTGLIVALELYAPDFTLVRREEFTTDITPEQYRLNFDTAAIKIPAEWSEKYFFLRAVVKNASGMLHQSFYWCKALDRFADRDLLNAWREKPQNNILFDKGPWLKPQIAALQADKAVDTNKVDAVSVGTDENAVSLKILSKSVRADENGESRVSLRVWVTAGNMPLFPVKLDIDEDKTLVYASDNAFFLGSYEVREIDMEVRVRCNADRLTLRLTAWNCNDIAIGFIL